MVISRSRGVAVAVGFVVSLAGTAVQAASEVDVGGFHERALRTTQQDLLGAPGAPTAPDLGTGLQVRAGPAPASALTGFTPRFGGLAISGRRHSEASLLTEEDGAPHRLQIGLGDAAQIAGWQVGLAATADMAPRGATSDGAGSALMVGGELAVSGLRFDAAVGRDPTVLGEDARRMTAGVGYDFGALDTHMGYSLVESDERAAATGMLTLGSQLALSRNLVLKGDLAIADEDRDGGAATTAGRVSLRLNF
jgi:hypothetical protein